VLTPEGFSIDEIVAFWDSNVKAALDAGFPFVRLGAEAGWWMPQMPGLDAFFRYESELKRFSGRYPQAILCMYDLEQYSENIVLDLLRTHPQVPMCGVPLEIRTTSHRTRTSRGFHGMAKPAERRDSSRRSRSTSRARPSGIWSSRCSTSTASQASTAQVSGQLLNGWVFRHRRPHTVPESADERRQPQRAQEGHGRRHDDRGVQQHIADREAGGLGHS
jgi:hypothetical protein